MAPPGGIEPHAFHPTLRTGLEDQCRARWYVVILSVRDLFVKSIVGSSGPNRTDYLRVTNPAHRQQCFEGMVLKQDSVSCGGFYT